MKRLTLIILGVLLCTPLYSDMNTYVIGSGVPGGAFCSNCGSGNLVFCWEVTADNTDITQSGGCSLGDYTATANSAISIEEAPSGKSGYAVRWTTKADYYSFDISGGDIGSWSAGTVVFDVYITTLYDYTGFLAIRGLMGEDEVFVELYNTDELRINHEGGNNSPVRAYTLGADLQVNTWYTVTAKWRTGETDPSLSISANSVTGTSNTNLDAFSNQPGSNGLMIGNFPNTPSAAYIKNIKIYNAWVD